MEISEKLQIKIKRSLVEQKILNADEADFTVLTQEYLDKVTSLKLASLAELKEVYDLGLNNQITNLSIEGRMDHYFLPEDSPELDTSALLQNFRNLRNLEILRVDNFKELDISYMPNLNFLKLVGNPNFEIISGLNRNCEVVEFECSACPKCKNFEQFIPFLDSKLFTEDAYKNDKVSKIRLDYKMFKDFNENINYQENPSFIKQCNDKIEWVDYDCDYIAKSCMTYDYDTMCKIHNTLLDKLYAFKVEAISDTLEVHTLIENTLNEFLRHLSKTQKYDIKSYKNPDGTIKTKEEFGLATSDYYMNNNIVRMARGQKFDTWSIKNAVLNNTTVCAGFVKEFNYFCKLLNLDTKEILVTDKLGENADNYKNVANHVISQINFEQGAKFLDPTVGMNKNFGALKSYTEEQVFNEYYIFDKDLKEKESLYTKNESKDNHINYEPNLIQQTAEKLK